MFQLSSLYFCLEVLAAENALLYACEKRKYFWIREVISLAICLTASYFFPVPSNLRFNQWYVWFRYLTIFALTCVQAFSCYKIKILPLLTFCTSGYLIQHGCFHLLNMFTKIPFEKEFSNFLSKNSAYFELGICALISIVLIFTIGRLFKKRQYYKNYNVLLSVLSIVTILVVTGITRVVRNEGRGGVSLSSSLYVICFVILILFLQIAIYRYIDLSNENKVLRRMRENDRTHYEIAKSTIENINIKAHDLKHMLNNSKIVDEAEKENILKSIDFFDELETGNHTIDVILIDHKLRYSQEGVSFTFNGNAQSLNFIREIDLASIFGNALANAAEAVVQLDNKEMRVISITLEDKGDLISLTFRNYYKGKITFNGKFPETSKKMHKIDHGFGLKSILKNVQKYNGNISINTDNNVFTLVVYFCKPEVEEVHTNK